MIPAALQEYERTDQTGIHDSKLPVTDAERHELATAGVPLTVRLPHHLSHLPARPSTAKHTSNPCSLPPLEPVLHIRGSPAEQYHWSGSLERGHERKEDRSMNLPSPDEKAMSGHQCPRHEPVTYNPKDPEKGNSEGTARQSSRRAISPIPSSRIKYIYSDVSEEGSDAEEHAIWLLVSLALANPS